MWHLCEYMNWGNNVGMCCALPRQAPPFCHLPCAQGCPGTCSHLFTKPNPNSNSVLTLYCHTSGCLSHAHTLNHCGQHASVSVLLCIWVPGLNSPWCVHFCSAPEEAEWRSWRRRRKRSKQKEKS